MGDGYTDENRPRSVLQDWVMDLPLRFQGTLLTGVRGCDLAPKVPCDIDERYGCSTGESSPERHLVAFLRCSFMNPADPREVDTPGSFFMSRPPELWKPSQLGHYPEHWYSHLMHAMEIVGYEHPDLLNVAFLAKGVYMRLVRNLHLYPESRGQMWDRLTEDRIESGEIVS